MHPGSQTIKTISDAVLEDGGEGIVLRAPKSTYQHGASLDLLKLKALRDQEALVTAVNQESCFLTLPSGISFFTPLPRLPLSTGDIVTFTYSHLEKKGSQNDETEHGSDLLWAPANPVITRVRHDVAWQDVVRGSETKRPQQRHANVLAQKVLARTHEKPFRNPLGYWTAPDNKNSRAFFLDFARSRNGDANDPAFWYSLSRADVSQDKRSESIIKHYGGSGTKTLLDLFPDIGLEAKRLFPHRRKRTPPHISPLSVMETVLDRSTTRLARNITRHI